MIPPASRPAATVMILREAAGRAPEILMMERSAGMAFAAGALVFPGGGVDAEDAALAARLDHGLEAEDAAARIAAIRETLEESGLAIGLDGPLEPARLARMRASLGAGATLADLLAVHGLRLALDRLLPFARWEPMASDKATRIYDTRFYLTRAPEGQVASADATENVRLFWSSAAATLALCDAGKARIIYPTRRNLERLAHHGGYAALAAHAASVPVEKISPWIEDREGEPYLCIPTHLGYPTTAEPLRRVQRG